MNSLSIASKLLYSTKEKTVKKNSGIVAVTYDRQQPNVCSCHKASVILLELNTARESLALSQESIRIF